MEFEFIGNASGIFHGNKGTRLLCDPWVMNGVFDGSWCHYPPLETKIEDLLSVDALYVSHIHQDHYDDRYFNFRKDIPIIVLDHKHNFLIKSLERNGFTNLIFIKNNETKSVKEFEITLYAPFSKNNFHEAKIGNLIDSAMVVQNDTATVINFNDNTPTVESCSMLKDKFGKIDLAMINYNAAGPYPSCFQNLSEVEKIEQHHNVLSRNYDHMVLIANELQPLHVLPFAGAYVLGGKQFFKNKCLGTDTWDACKEYISSKIDESINVVCLRERDIFDLTTGKSNNDYVPIDVKHMNDYIENEISQLTYPYEKDDKPDMDILLKDIKIASIAMHERMSRIGIKLNTEICLNVDKREITLYSPSITLQKLVCELDDRLLRRILDHKSHWNNAEIGCHIDFHRVPNIYEPDAHTALQFFHN